MVTNGDGSRGRCEVAVVGGGLAGLTCAHGLARAGGRVTVLEAAEDAGGRARTVWHRGRPVDRGFQIVFGAYPRTRALVRRRRDSAARHAPGVGRRRVPPRCVHRAPSGRRAPAGAVHRPPRRGPPAPGGPRRGGQPDPVALLADPMAEADRTEAYLRDRGFCDESIEGFFRPFFGVVLQDRSLERMPATSVS